MRKHGNTNARLDDSPLHLPTQLAASCKNNNNLGIKAIDANKLPETYATCCWKCCTPLKTGIRKFQEHTVMGLPVDARCPRCPRHGVHCVALQCVFWRRNVEWKFAGRFCTLGCVADAAADASFLLRMMAIDVCSRKPPLRLFLRFVFGKTAARRPDLWRRLRRLPPIVKRKDSGGLAKMLAVPTSELPGSVRRLDPKKEARGTPGDWFFSKISLRMRENAMRIRSQHTSRSKSVLFV